VGPWKCQRLKKSGDRIRIDFGHYSNNKSSPSRDFRAKPSFVVYTRIPCVLSSLVNTGRYVGLLLICRTMTLVLTTLFSSLSRTVCNVDRTEFRCCKMAGL
jgi:hypothetical protein